MSLIDASRSHDHVEPTAGSSASATDPDRQRVAADAAVRHRVAADVVRSAADAVRAADADAADTIRRAADAIRGAFDTTLTLRHAGPRTLRLAFECQGPADAPVLLVAGGISAHRHVAASASFPEPGWWPGQAGPGRALDTARWRVLAIDWLGADGNLDLAIDSADQADAFARADGERYVLRDDKAAKGFLQVEDFKRIV